MWGIGAWVRARSLSSLAGPSHTARPHPLEWMDHRPNETGRACGWAKLCTPGAELRGGWGTWGPAALPVGVVSHQTLTMIFPGRASFIMTHVLRWGLGWGWGLAMALPANGRGPFPLTLASAYTPPPTERSRPPGGPLPSPADHLAPRFWETTLSSRTSRFLLYELGATGVPPSGWM